MYDKAARQAGMARSEYLRDWIMGGDGKAKSALPGGRRGALPAAAPFCPAGPCRRGARAPAGGPAGGRPVLSGRAGP